MNVDQSNEMADLLVDLQFATIRELLARAKSGEITSGEAGQVVQLCKLNNVTIDYSEGDIPEDVKDGLLASIAGEKILPFVREA
jgi:hypothetical protein